MPRLVKSKPSLGEHRSWVSFWPRPDKSWLFNELNFSIWPSCFWLEYLSTLNFPFNHSEMKLFSEGGKKWPRLVFDYIEKCFILYHVIFVKVPAFFWASFFLLCRLLMASHRYWWLLFVATRKKTNNKTCAQDLNQDLSSLSQDLLWVRKVLPKTCPRLVRSSIDSRLTNTWDLIQDVPSQKVTWTEHWYSTDRGLPISLNQYWLRLDFKSLNTHSQKKPQLDYKIIGQYQSYQSFNGVCC